MNTKPYLVMWCSNTGWHTQRFAAPEQAERCAARHGVKVIAQNWGSAAKKTLHAKRELRFSIASMLRLLVSAHLTRVTGGTLSRSAAPNDRPDERLCR